jgi:hypothetical protein
MVHFTKLVEQNPILEANSSFWFLKYYIVTDYKKKLNSVALVRKRTIPTERPPLVGEVSANLCG